MAGLQEKVREVTEEAFTLNSSTGLVAINKHQNFTVTQNVDYALNICEVKPCIFSCAESLDGLLLDTVHT